MSDPADASDPTGDELAERLAELVWPMRATSRFAVQTFLQAVEGGLRGASLTLHAPERPGKPPEASVEIDPRGSS